MNCRVVVSIKDVDACRKVAATISERFAAQVIAAGNLYDLPDDHELWNILRSPVEDLVVFARMHPRPMRCLIQNADAGYTNIHCVDFGEFENETNAADYILDYISKHCNPNPGESELLEIHSLHPSRWYPIIDRSLCVDCGECEQFCLFGVYTHSDVVRVDYPDNCKPGCPACSRICPHGAIIFPRYTADPAISGAPGHVMTPDAHAREMYAKRKGKTAQAPLENELRATESSEFRPFEDDSVDDELDKLIDEFDKLQFGE